MTPQNHETTNKFIFEIPGLYGLINYFDNNLSTGTISILKDRDYWKEFSQKNIAGPIQKYPDEALSYFYRPLNSWRLQEFESSWNKAIWDAISLEAKNLLSSVKNDVLANEANAILDAIKNNLIYFDIVSLPVIRAFELESGSIAFEWIIGHFRIGFNFDPKPEESGYYLISDKAAGEIRFFGYFNGLNKQNIIKSLLVLILGK